MKSPFEIYYGRKPNVVETKGNQPVKEWDIPSDRYQGMIHPRSKDYTDHARKTRKLRNLAHSATTKCADRMVKRGVRNNPPSVYDIGETVLIRYPPAKKVASKRHILEADIIKRNLRLQKYQVAFISPTSGKLTYKWIPVNDITSVTMEEEKKKRKSTLKEAERKKKKKAHMQKYRQGYEDDRSLFEDRSGSAHYVISYDPPKDGNCQFSAISKLLQAIGIFRSNQTLRREIVRYLEANPSTSDGTPLQNFTDLPWPQYLAEMSQNGTFGDHITLQAASNLFNIAFVVISSLGAGATATLSPMDSNPLCTFMLGHYAENAGEHYVCLENEPDWTGDTTTACEQSPPVSPGDNNIPMDSDTPLQEMDGNQEMDGPYLNPDCFEEIIQQTLDMYPYMRQALRAVSRSFKNIVDRQPLPMIYLPELNDMLDIQHVSVRRIMKLKGKNSGVVLRLREIINCVKWAFAWLSFIAAGYGWFFISKIYWKGLNSK